MPELGRAGLQTAGVGLIPTNSLDVTPQAARRIVLELGLTEITGEGVECPLN